MKKYGSYLVSINKAVVAGLGSLWLALDDDVLTRQEGVAVALATLGVWAIPNLDPRGKRQRESVQPPA